MVRVLVVGCLLFGASLAVKAEDFTWEVNSGNAAGQTTDNSKYGIKIHNISGEAINVYTEEDTTHLRSPGANSSGNILNDKITFSPAIPSGWSVVTPGAPYYNFPGVFYSGSTSIANGSDGVVYFDSYDTYQTTGVSNDTQNWTTTVTFTIPLWIKRASDAAYVRRVVGPFKKTILFKARAGSTTAVAAPKTTVAGVAVLLFGTLDYSGPAVVGTGHIRAFGASAGTNGLAEVKIWLGGKVVGQGFYTGGDGDAVPDVVYNVTDPWLDVGKTIKISLNGAYWPNGWQDTVALDASGSYSYEYNLGPHQMEVGVPDLVASQDPGEVGVEPQQIVNNTDPVFDGLPEDTAHNRPADTTANAANGAVDPKTDTATNTTVKQEYAAVRAAIEDALGKPPSSSDFDFGKWLGDDLTTADEKTKAGGFADSMKGAVGALGDIGGSLTDAATSGAIAPTLGPSTGIVLHNGGGSVIGIIPPPQWAGLFRQAMLYVLYLIFGLATVSIARSAFAGR